jgi:hypothetical protein
VRFDFADAVVTELLGFDLRTKDGMEKFRELMQALREANFALGQFVLAAVSTYLGWRPPGRASG